MKRGLWQSRFATALGSMAASTDAVMLSARGTGQVLIYPYYTVNHQQTLVSVIKHDRTRQGAEDSLSREAYDGP